MHVCILYISVCADVCVYMPKVNFGLQIFARVKWIRYAYEWILWGQMFFCCCHRRIQHTATQWNQTKNTLNTQRIEKKVVSSSCLQLVAKYHEWERHTQYTQIMIMAYIAYMHKYIQREIEREREREIHINVHTHTNGNQTHKNTRTTNAL